MNRMYCHRAVMSVKVLSVHTVPFVDTHNLICWLVLLTFCVRFVSSPLLLSPLFLSSLLLAENSGLCLSMRFHNDASLVSMGTTLCPGGQWQPQRSSETWRQVGKEEGRVGGVGGGSGGGYGGDCATILVFFWRTPSVPPICLFTRPRCGPDFFQSVTHKSSYSAEFFTLWRCREAAT